MAEFLNHTNIRQELMKLIKTSERVLFLVSPFIKLNDEMKRGLEGKKKDIKFEIVVLFGKNEENLSKSLSKEDMEFFREFKNVRILYNPDLHAKYYANESCAIITSLNLHQYSVRNNIEIGIRVERKLLNLTGEKRLDHDAFDYIYSILDESAIVYEHHIKQDSSFFGLFKGKIQKEIGTDNTDKIYINHDKQDSQKNHFTPKNIPGFCIRTGEPIPFNMNEPFSKQAYFSWAKWRNPEFQERYCHFSGEESIGETSFAKPVLRKNYSEAIRLQKHLHDH